VSRQVERNGDRRVAIITPWYPGNQRPFLGAFVRAMVEATAPVCDHLVVYHCDEWPTALTAQSRPGILSAFSRLLPRALRTTVEGAADYVYLPVPVAFRSAYADLARNHETALRSALGGRPIDAPVVHAHVGLPGGWAALHNARPDARIFVTEHATFLDAILAQPEARQMYDEVIARSTGFFAVGNAVRDPLAEAFPHHRDKIRVIPNPVSFADLRPEPVKQLHRWLYVGSLTPRKGVRWIIEALAACRADDPQITLTLVGEGPDQAELEDLAERLGVRDALTITGALAPARALEMMRKHDLLVHASRLETFGMTIVEAIAAGLPVLVTRCGGPEETLAGIEDAAGEMVAVQEAPDSLIAGYRRLRDRFPHGVDLDLARKQLAARYGYEAVARAHSAAWFATPASVLEPEAVA
jgi:glycogen(starch) synthase